MFVIQQWNPDWTIIFFYVKHAFLEKFALFYSLFSISCAKCRNKRKYDVFRHAFMRVKTVDREYSYSLWYYDSWQKDKHLELQLEVALQKYKFYEHNSVESLHQDNLSKQYLNKLVKRNYKCGWSTPMPSCLLYF